MCADASRAAAACSKVISCGAMRTHSKNLHVCAVCLRTLMWRCCLIPNSKKHMGRAVVIHESILAVRHPDTPDALLTVLRSSVLRGAAAPDMHATTLAGIDPKSWREATRQDFDNFNVHWHPDYTN